MKTTLTFNSQGKEEKLQNIEVWLECIMKNIKAIIGTKLDIFQVNLKVILIRLSRMIFWKEQKIMVIKKMMKMRGLPSLRTRTSLKLEL